MKKEFLFYYMANLVPKDSGLRMNIHITPKFGKKSPCICIQKDYNKILSANIFSITVEEVPRVIGKIGKIKKVDIEKAKKFIRLNKQLLLDYWNGKESDLVFIITNLKKV